MSFCTSSFLSTLGFGTLTTGHMVIQGTRESQLKGLYVQFEAIYMYESLFYWPYMDGLIRDMKNETSPSISVV